MEIVFSKVDRDLQMRLTQSWRDGQVGGISDFGDKTGKSAGGTRSFFQGADLRCDGGCK